MYAVHFDPFLVPLLPFEKQLTERSAGNMTGAKIHRRLRCVFEETGKTSHTRYGPIVRRLLFSEKFPAG